MLTINHEVVKSPGKFLISFDLGVYIWTVLSKKEVHLGPLGLISSPLLYPYD